MLVWSSMARNQKYVFPSTARYNTRSSLTYFHSLSNSDIGLSRNGRAGSAGGVRRMARLAVNPTAASATRIAPDRYCRRSEEHTSELQSHHDLVCRLLLEKKKKKQ